MTDRPVIKLDGLTVRYGKFTAVEDLSICVPRGSVYALLGRNGSGKSSTVRCLLGQQRASAGQVRLLGLDSWKKRRRIMTAVGAVPESPNIPPETTAEGLEGFMAKVSTRWDRGKYFSRLERFGISRTTRFKSLSKGQQKQLSLTAAISSSPEVLILDDPTLGLDPVARRELFEELVNELAERGTTVFITTHDLEGVERIADRVGIIKDGDLLIDEQMEPLKARFRRLVCGPDGERILEIAAERMQAVNSGGAVAVGGGVAEVVVGRFDENALGSVHESEPSVRVSAESMSLEEIFIALCGENGGGQ